MKLFLEKINQESPDVVSFIFKPEKTFVWRAGQFLHYTLEHPNPDSRKTERYFTISSAPFEGRVMITTRFNEKGSSFKKALRALPIGGTIEASEPDGEFFIDDPEKEYIFIAGGIGITPFRSIILDLAHRDLPINALLLYASGTPDFVFKNELEAIAKKSSSFKIKYFIGQNKIDEAAIKYNIPDLNKPVFYISGPEPMVQTFEKMLKTMGVPDEHIKRDYFPGYTWP